MYEYLARHPELFPAVMGITEREFKDLLNKFRPALDQGTRTKAYRKKRLRHPGAGRKAKLQTPGQKLLFILLYYKLYPTFRLAQCLFQLDKRNVQLWVRFLEPVLWQTLGYQLDLPLRRAKDQGVLIEICPALKGFIIDCTERPINRPKNISLQQHYYSGKKKQHTVKNQLVVNPKTKKILAISNTVEGKRHDKKVMEQDLLFSYCPPGSTGLADSGYQGTDGLYPRLKMITPLKKPPNGKLTDGQKATNKSISQVRVRVEHPISYLKHFNILSHKFRNRLHHAHQPFQILAALYNFTRPYT